MKDIPFIAVYSSISKRRAIRPDTMLHGSNISLKFDKRLKEINFGDWEGEYTRTSKKKPFPIRRTASFMCLRRIYC